MKPEVLERRVATNGAPVAKVRCTHCDGDGTRWVYDYDTDPALEWKLLWRTVKAKFRKLFGRKP